MPLHRPARARDRLGGLRGGANALLRSGHAPHTRQTALLGKPPPLRACSWCLLSTLSEGPAWGLWNLT